MPTRMVDGAGIWKSTKIKKLKAEYKAEFANLCPLAEANGVFEVDVDRIWSDVYSYNREEVSKSFVRDLVCALIDVGLLLVWEERGKLWGFWEGNEKPGRLPPYSERKKYKNLPPDPPGEFPAPEDAKTVFLERS